MGRQIKLIWDMHGPHAKGTAAHHAIHLEEYAQKENMETSGSGTEDVTDFHSIAYLCVDEKDMIKVRDALRPHRAEAV